MLKLLQEKLNERGLQVTTEDAIDAVELIEMNMQECNLNEKEAVSEWINDTLNNCPEYFI